MDLIIHVSLQDLQRNLDEYTREGGTSTALRRAGGMSSTCDKRWHPCALL